MTPPDFENAWARSPWGMAAINPDGNVCAVNPAFSTCCGMPAAQLLGLSEAGLRVLLDALPLERHRVEADGAPDVIYYIRLTTQQRMDQQWLSHLAETLREPLASVYGFTELLLTQDYEFATRRDLTKTMLDQLDLMINLINERLDTSKPLVAWPTQGALDKKKIEAP